MAPVVLEVGEIVQQVDARGTQPEGHEGDRQVQECRGVGEVLRGDQRHEQQGVLQPLMDAHGSQISGEATARRPLRGRFVLQPPFARARRPSRHAAVQHAVEQANLAGDLVAPALRRVADQIEPPSAGPFRFQSGENGLVERQRGALGLDVAGHLARQSLASTQGPQGQQEHGKRRPLQPSDDRFKQQVAPNQAAIEFDDQRIRGGDPLLRRSAVRISNRYDPV
jgi:hypothetical protein